MEYNDIKTPQELLSFMNNIKYGYITKDNKIRLNNYSYWFNTYKLQSSKEILNNMIGTCWDQVELEREWFIDHNYEIKTFYEQIILDYENDYPTHSFLVFKNEDKWYWFENAFHSKRGIHQFDTLEKLLNYEKKEYISVLKELNINENELNQLLIKEFTKPKSNISAKEYIERIIGD